MQMLEWHCQRPSGAAGKLAQLHGHDGTGDDHDANDAGARGGKAARTSSPTSGGQGGNVGAQGQGSVGTTGNAGEIPSPQEPGDSETESPNGDEADNEPGKGSDDLMSQPPEDDEKLNEFFGVGCAVHSTARPSGSWPVGLAMGCVWALARRRRRRGSA